MKTQTSTVFLCYILWLSLQDYKIQSERWMKKKEGIKGREETREGRRKR